MGFAHRTPSSWRLRLGLALLVAALAWTGRAGAARAQAQPGDEVRYTFALVGIPLADALEQLLDATRLSLVYESGLVAGRTTFCAARRVTAEELLSCILDDTGLDYVRLSSGTYVLVEDRRAAPRYASLTGQVVDAETGLPLADASVLIAGENTGAATNRDGRFAFAALHPGPHRLVVSHVAYYSAIDTVYVRPDEQGRLAIPLEPRVILSAPVVVSSFAMRPPSDDLGVERRTPEEQDDLGNAGAPDVVQSLKAVVGVRLGDALSDVHVQGGASDEQQFFLDGVPVFMPVANGGFVGPFSPFAAGQVTVRKAGFGAAHGSGLSGVIEVEQHLGAREGERLMAQVDPLSLNARWNGRAGAPEQIEARWMLALRKSLWDYYAPRPLVTLFRDWSTPDFFLFETLDPAFDPPGEPGATNDTPRSLEVNFNDVHAMAQVRFGGLRSLRAGFYRGANSFGIEDVQAEVLKQSEEDPEDLFEDAYHWRNHAAQLRYEWVQSRRLFLNVGAWLTGYRLTHPVIERVDSSRASAEFNAISETGMRVAGDLAASALHTVAAGLEAVHTDSDFTLSLDPFGDAPHDEAQIQPVRWRFAAFVEDRLVLSPRTTLVLGTRLTYLPGQQAAYAEPRLALQYDRAAWAARGAVGRYRQYLHSFDVATYNVAALVPRVRFWLPVGEGQRPPEAYHATLALQYRIGAGWDFGAETYYKHQPHLLVLDYGNRLTGEGEGLRDADGYAFGAALTAARRGRYLQVDAQYEYAVARRRVANRFDGAFVPVPWDAPHRLYAALDLLPLPHWTATVRWQGVFGRSWGFRQSYYDFLEPDPATRSFPPFDLSDPAAHRLPAFAQLDVGLAYARNVAGVGVQARLAFVNLLDRRNVTDWSLRYDEAAQRYVRHARHAASFLPSFSLRLSI